MPSSVSDMVASANAEVPRITPPEARRLIDEQGALLVDVRDAPELIASGKLKDAVNVSRGMIEFRADAAAPTHDAAFTTDRPLILYCASGGRSALTCKTLKDMGYDVYNLGAFKDAAAAGFPTETA